MKKVLVAISVAVLALMALGMTILVSRAEAHETGYDLHITVFWEVPADGGYHDVDMKVLAPGEQKAVTFKAKRVGRTELLRDELATRWNDSPPSAPIFFEMAVVTNAETGEYVVNVQRYRGSGPVKVTVVVDRIRESGTVRKIAQSTVTIPMTNEHIKEVTALSFVLGPGATIVDGSASQEYRDLSVPRPPEPEVPVEEDSLWTE